MNKDLRNNKVAAIPSKPGAYRFPSGDKYIRTENGQIFAAEKRHYRNKAERKKWMKFRRKLRKQTPADLAMAS